jgi:outer membrane protein OmpA-like peptidoglycan-associated protein
MKKTYLLLLAVLFSNFYFTQVTLIGHNMINNTPVKYTRIYVKQGSVVTKTLDTRTTADFKLQLDFGKVYHIYFQNPMAPLMYMEVKADDIPADKYEYRMTYELNVPFANKDDEDIDTTAFGKAFHKVIFNGKSKMVDDTTYNNAFARTVLKKPVVVKQQIKETEDAAPVIIAGKILLSEAPALPAANHDVQLLNEAGSVLKSTVTNRYGAFTFTNIKIKDLAQIKMSARDGNTDQAYTLVNSQNTTVSASRPYKGAFYWDLDHPTAEQLVDNNYTSNIGGKLVASSSKEKKFFANKNIYLSNKHNTIIQTAKTNILGTFVFENIRPDHIYFLGVDKRELAPGEKIDLLNKSDAYVGTLDSVVADRNSLRLQSTPNKLFNEVSIDEKDMSMDVKATIFGDNVNNPIGKLKIILLNDKYEVIDSALTDDLGSFKFQYLPFLKRFYLSAENTENMLDVFQNILIYSSEHNLIKIMTHQKGKKFSYKPINAEITSLREVELEDPWLQLMNSQAKNVEGENKATEIKSIIEKILFENNKYNITDESKEILDKIIVVLKSNKLLKLEIGAHTDSKGSDASNIKLSQLRAETVRNYLLGAGIDQQRIFAKGYGESKLLNGCKDNIPCSEAEHALNRRIDFKILE